MSRRRCSRPVTAGSACGTLPTGSPPVELSGAEGSPDRLRAGTCRPDVWYLDESLAGPQRYLQTEFVWAALDCASAIGAIGNAQVAGMRGGVYGQKGGFELLRARTRVPALGVWRLVLCSLAGLAGPVQAVAASAGCGCCALTPLLVTGMGRCPVMMVPRLGADWISRWPWSAASRSAMFRRPEPIGVRLVS